jgi:hypothetical protein
MSFVPCNGCTRCCKGDAVRLLSEDNISSFITEPHPILIGEVMLAHKQNRDCIYLDTNSCSIHDRRPIQCRTMDCRNLARTFNYTQARKLDAQNKLKIGIWKKGHELLNVKTRG